MYCINKLFHLIFILLTAIDDDDDDFLNEYDAVTETKCLYDILQFLT
jgi:hypothetical protein